MISENNVTYLYVGNVTNGYADAANCDFNTMPLGSIALVTAEASGTGGRTVEEGAISNSPTVKYQIVNKTSTGEVRISPMFLSGDIVTRSLKSYLQPTQQVSFMGYNGTTVTGLGTFTVGNSYDISFWLKHTQNTLNNTPEIKHIGYYALGTTQAAAAKAFMESFLRNFAPHREPNPTIICDRVALTTSVAAITGNATIYKVTKGSKTVETYVKAAAGNTTLTASTATVTAGNIVHVASSNARTFTFSAVALGAGAGRHLVWIGTTVYNIADAGTDAQNATAIVAAINAGTQATAVAVGAAITVTYNEGQYYLPPMVLSTDDDATYALVAVTAASGDVIPVKYVAAATTNAAATFELDLPWQGPTGFMYESTGAAATSTIGIATLTSDTWGLKFSGVQQPFIPLTDNPEIVEFDVLSEALVGVTEYKSVSPSKGSGSWRDVAHLEGYAQGNDRFYYANDMIQGRTFEAQSGKYYDILTLGLSTQPFTSAATGISPKNTFTIVLAIDRSLTYETLHTAFGVTAV